MDATTRGSLRARVTTVVMACSPASLSLAESLIQRHAASPDAFDEIDVFGDLLDAFFLPALTVGSDAAASNAGVDLLVRQFELSLYCRAMLEWIHDAAASRVAKGGSTDVVAVPSTFPQPLRPASVDASPIEFLRNGVVLNWLVGLTPSQPTPTATVGGLSIVEMQAVVRNLDAFVNYCLHHLGIDEANCVTVDEMLDSRFDDVVIRKLRHVVQRIHVEFSNDSRLPPAPAWLARPHGALGTALSAEHRQALERDVGLTQATLLSAASALSIAVSESSPCSVAITHPGLYQLMLLPVDAARTGKGVVPVVMLDGTWQPLVCVVGRLLRRLDGAAAVARWTPRLPLATRWAAPNMSGGGVRTMTGGGVRARGYPKRNDDAIEVEGARSRVLSKKKTDSEKSKPTSASSPRKTSEARSASSSQLARLRAPGAPPIQRHAQPEAKLARAEMSVATSSTQQQQEEQQESTTIDDDDEDAPFPAPPSASPASAQRRSSLDALAPQEPLIRVPGAPPAMTSLTLSDTVSVSTTTPSTAAGDAPAVVAPAPRPSLWATAAAREDTAPPFFDFDVCRDPTDALRHPAEPLLPLPASGTREAPMRVRLHQAPGSSPSSSVAETLVGRGGFGFVYRCIDLRSGEAVAVKIVPLTPSDIAWCIRDSVPLLSDSSTAVTSGNVAPPISPPPSAFVEPVGDGKPACTTSTSSAAPLKPFVSTEVPTENTVSVGTLKRPSVLLGAAQLTSTASVALRELETVSALAHPGIIRCHGSRVFLERSALYLVMELATGGSLTERMRQFGPLPTALARRMLLQLTESVAYLHHAGLVHADLKPDNVLLREDGSTVLVDFGCSLLVGAETQRFKGRYRGTPQYTSPEVARGEEVTPALDVWAISCIAVVVLTGVGPWQHMRCSSLMTLLFMIAQTADMPFVPDVMLRVRISDDEAVNAQFRDVIGRGFSLRPETRASIDDIRTILARQ